MKQHSVDAIERYATGQTLFTNEVNAITHVAATNLESSGLVSEKNNTTTLADLISRLPAQQQAGVLTRVLEIAAREHSGEQLPLQNDQSNELG